MADAPMAFKWCRDFSDNQLSGYIPKSLGRLVNLYELWVMSFASRLIAVRHSSRLHNVFIAIYIAYAPMASKWCRDLSGNQLSGSIPEALGSLIKLKHLWVMSYACLLIAVRHSSRLHKVWICIWHGWCSNRFRFVQKFGCERIEWIHSSHFGQS